jgi:hypothetical protein
MFAAGLALVVALQASPGAAGDETPASEQPPPAKLSEGQAAVRAELDALIEQLDSPRFDVRRRAAERLEVLCARPGVARLAAETFERLLVSPGISFEVRSRLKQLKRDLPAVERRPADEVSLEEIGRLIARLEAASFSVRLGARKRLEWLLENPKLAWPVMRRLKQRLAAADHSADARQWLEPVYERARGAWLLGDPSQLELPEVPQERIDELIGRLARAAPADLQGTWVVHRTARRELCDLLAREDCTERVLQALRQRLDAGGLDPRADARLQQLVDLARPAMVAEYWQDRRNLGEQHLLIGVPSMTEGAQRPSHFDRIDEEVAHCVSGNSLSPGDYPVGVAFPHPRQPGAFFHLVNLPTPRRRMAYKYHVKTDETQRLRAISRRTLNRFLARKEPLEEAELAMLWQLDPSEVSRFAGALFLAVDDRPLPPGTESRGTAGRPSHHGMMCVFLADEGTREAMPRLLEAIERGRFLPPATGAPYRLPHVAALAIAARDPWPGIDRWLIDQLSSDLALVQGDDSSPQLAATAAGILVKRHDRSAADFRLLPASPGLFERFKLDGYRFDTDDDRRRAAAWWTRWLAERKAAEST